MRHIAKPILILVFLSLLVAPGCQDGAEWPWSKNKDPAPAPADPAKPGVQAIVPSNVPTTGGVTVAIRGVNFEDGAVVFLYGQPCTPVTFVDAFELQVTAPPHPPGSVDVEVVNPSDAYGRLENGLHYTDAPVLTGLTPTQGSQAGGTAITLSGFNFQTGATVTVGGTPASSIVVVSSTQITCDTPAGTVGTRDVRVTNPDTRFDEYSGFTYLASPPTVSSVTPPSGTNMGGNTVTVSGSWFQNGATVKFGPLSAGSVTFVNATTLQAVVPAGPHAPAPVGVTVTNPDAQAHTKTGAYQYVFSSPAPTVTAVNPSSGPPGTHNAITVTGTGFQAGAILMLGPYTPSSVTVVSATSITAATPVVTGLTGNTPVTVQVTNPDTQSGSLAAGYTFVPPGGNRVVTYQIDGSVSCDLWYFDFSANLSRFQTVMVNAGLHTNGGDSYTDNSVEDWLQAQILGYTSSFYRRNSDGTKVSGSSFNVCFVGTSPPSPWIPPPSTQGNAQPNQYNILHFMDTDPNSTSALGRAWMDLSTGTGGLPDNGRRENNSRANSLGIFMTPIWGNLVSWGRVSVLNPALSASDRNYVDGTYTLGSGTSAQDSRFLAIRSRIANFADGLCTVAMHEIGHSLGLVITSRNSSVTGSHCPNTSCPMYPVATWGNTTFCTGTSSCTAELAAAVGYSP